MDIFLDLSLVMEMKLTKREREEEAEEWICILIIAHRISHGTNVVVVNNQSANSKFFLLLFDWMLTMTTFVPWDILWAMIISHYDTIVNSWYMLMLPMTICSWHVKMKLMLPLLTLEGEIDQFAHKRPSALMSHEGISVHRKDSISNNLTTDNK